MIDQSVLEKAKCIKMLVVDIDGVMTDGRIVYSGYGEELKFFDVQDGFGITLLATGGVRTIIITAKKSKIVKHRARDLRVARAYQGFLDKLTPFNDLLKRFNVTAAEVCFMGDDLIDLPVLKRVGLAVAVSNAVEEVKSCAHYVTVNKGGRGAVREICDIILKSQNKWDEVTSEYFQ
ncbi:MAG: HAD-IIIA family hydrolase [Candidatus Omnitrophota bacterium]